MQENTKEIWRPIRGYENLYEVSNLGKVRSLDRLVRRCTCVARVDIKQLEASNGHIKNNNLIQ